MDPHPGERDNRKLETQKSPLVLNTQFPPRLRLTVMDGLEELSSSNCCIATKGTVHFCGQHC